MITIHVGEEQFFVSDRMAEAIRWLAEMNPDIEVYSKATVFIGFTEEKIDPSLRLFPPSIEVKTR